jgi:hypothetical protein
MAATVTANLTTTALDLAGGAGIAEVLPVAILIGTATASATTDATGAWTYSGPLVPPGTTIKATCQGAAVPQPAVTTTEPLSSYCPTLASINVPLAGNVGGPFPTTITIGGAVSKVTPSSTGAWTLAEGVSAEMAATPVTVTYTPAPVLPAPSVATTTVPGIPAGLTINGAPVVVGTALTPGTPFFGSPYISFPFTGNWASGSNTVGFSIDGKLLSQGPHNGGANSFAAAAASFTGAHTAVISDGTSSITWQFSYEPAVAPAPPVTTGGGGTTPPGGGTTTTTPTLVMPPPFPAATAAGQLGSIMFRADKGASGAVYQTTHATLAQGLVPKGSGVTVGGKPAQIDVHSTWPDGSALSAQISAMSPALTAGQETFEIAVIGAAPTGTPVKVSIPVGELTVDFTIGTTAINLDVGTMLSTLPQTAWISGPLASEARVWKQVAGFLRLVVDARVYADGSSYVVLGLNADLAFEATSPLATFGAWGTIGYLNLTYGSQDFLYSATVTRNGTVLKTISSLTQTQYSVGHVVSDTRTNAPTMLLDQRVHIASGLMPRFELSLGVLESTIAGYVGNGDFTTNGWVIPSTAPATPSYTPVPTLPWGGLTLYMGTTGGRNDIGMVTDATSALAMTYDPGMLAMCLAQAEGASSIPWHLFDGPNNCYVNNINRPNLWPSYQALYTGGGAYLPLPADQQMGGGPWTLDDAHMPNASVIPYLLTGERRYLDDLLAEATWCVTGEGNKNIIVNVGQVRGQAWCLRQVAYAALLCDDADSIKPWLQTVLQNNINTLLNDTALATSEGELALYPFSDSAPSRFAPWEGDFLIMPVVMLCDCGVAGAKELLTKLAGWAIGGSLPQTGWNPWNRMAYYWPINDQGPYLSGPAPAGTSDVTYTTWAQTQTTLIVMGWGTAVGAEGQPQNSSLQYAAGWRQSTVAMHRILNTTDTVTALEFVNSAAAQIGGGDSFAQASPSFAILGP